MRSSPVPACFIRTLVHPHNFPRTPAGADSDSEGAGGGDLLGIGYTSDGGASDDANAAATAGKTSALGTPSSPISQGTARTGGASDDSKVGLGYRVP